MKKLFYNKVSFILLAMFAIPTVMFAGNEQRAGQAGAGQLLINPWARTTGFGQANSASIRGLESLSLNVAGSAFVTKTELIFSNSSWMPGININSFGLTQKVGETGAFSL